MSNIGGKKREGNFTETVKSIGIFEAQVVIINPSEEEYKDVLGIELKEDSKATEYLGESKDGNTYLRIAVWLKNMKDGEIFPSPVTFFLENKERENKDGSKKQYINNVGSCSWADDPNNLPDWFVARDYRVAFVGEEELFNFMRMWLGSLDYRDKETVLSLDWKKLMKGNVKELREQIDGEWCTNFGVLATIATREKDGEVKEYQNCYNRMFLPAYSIKNFRLVDYDSEGVINKLLAKKPKDLKAHEKFVVQVKNMEYGLKDFALLKDLQEYSSEMNVTAGDKVKIDPADSTY